MPGDARSRAGAAWKTRILITLALLVWIGFLAALTHRSKSPDYLDLYSGAYLLFLALLLGAALVVSLLAYLLLRRPWPQLRGIGRPFGVLFVVGLLTVALAELAMRSLDPLGVSMFQEVTRYMLDLDADDELGFRHRPNLVATYQGVEFRTNAIGLRDRALADIPASALRVLVLGDSVTLGWGVRQDALFTRRLEERLSGELARPVRVFNSGVAGYNTGQELAFLRRYAGQLTPDIVVLVYVENDVERNELHIDELRRRWDHPAGLREWLLRWSWLYRIVDTLGPIVMGPAAPPGRPDPGWSESMQALSEVNRVAAANGARFVVFLYRLGHDPATDRLQRDIGAVASTDGFEFHDTLPWFDGSRPRR